jgi:hypothetical protein
MNIKELQEKLSNITVDDLMNAANIMVLIGSNSKGVEKYYYMNVPLTRFENLMKAKDSDSFKAETYGEVLARGEGEPDEATQKMMIEKHGFNHDNPIFVKNPPQED